MKQLFSLLTAISFTLSGLAQTGGKISGVIKDGGDQKVIDAASVSLLQSKDSSLVKIVVADNQGNFLFENIKDGNYIVLASSIGHNMVYSKPFEISETQKTIDIGTLQLVQTKKDLKEVVVTAKKPFIERKTDRTVVNVDASITNAGTSAMDVLEKSPGVTVDKDGNISLKGKQGVIIMIDGKPAYLSGQDLANFLKSMPSSTLDQIEIMTNPSAKYDAAGNSGIINLKTKKNKQKGFNGSINTTYTQGVYAKTNNSLLLNYRNGKVNLFSTISGNYHTNYQSLDILRDYKNPDGSFSAIFQQHSDIKYFDANLNAKIGADFYATPKTTFGIVLTGYSVPSHTGTTNTNYLKDGNAVIDSIVVAESGDKSKWKNGAVNLNFRHQYDSLGTEITADADYINYSINKNDNFSNITYTPDFVVKDSDLLTGELPTSINIYSFKTDFTHPFKSGLKLESGLKTSYVETDNTAAYFNIVNGDKQVDYTKTNRFQYKENINAAYVNFSKEIKTWSLQAGLRFENTNYDGHQFGNAQRPDMDSTFKKSYYNLFPTFYASYNANAKNTFSFSFGRRIDRPDYESLNPFLFFLDKYTYEEGNPFLRPSYSNTFELSHTYNQFLTTTLNYSHTTDLFSEAFRSDATNKYASIVSQDNFASSDQLTLSMSAQIPVAKWWTSIVYAEGDYSSYKGIIYTDTLNVHSGNFLVNINNQFSLGKGWSAELSGFYRTKGIQGQIIADPMGKMDFGIQKQVLKNKGTIKLNVQDFMGVFKQRGEIDFQNTAAYFKQHGELRTFTLNFIYRFGKPITGLKKRKTGGADEEQNRVKKAG